jgi:hypothetical protein
MRGGVRFLTRRRALHGVQYLVALIDARPQLLLARKSDSVVKVTNDAAVPQVQLGREIECEGHARITVAGRGGSCGSSHRDNEDMRNGWRNLSIHRVIEAKGRQQRLLSGVS